MKTRKKTVQMFAVAIIAIVVAYVCSILDRSGIGGHLFGFIRAFIYLSLFTIWILRIKYTIQQQATRRYLLAAGILMLLWIYIRAIKSVFTLSPTGMRACWYLYYLPMLFIPVTALLGALTIGKADGKRLNAKTLFFLLISGALLAAVLTNDLHQLVFVFPNDVAPALWSDHKYTYGPVYFVIVGWMAAAGIGAITVMYGKSKVPHIRKYFWIGLVPIGLALSYTAVYYAGFPWLRYYLGDMTVTHCLLFTATFEWCILCGMIRSNSRYAELFEVSVDCTAQIADRDLHIRYSASDVRPVTREQMQKALASPLPLKDGRVLHLMPVSGGYALWTEDNTELLAKEEELKNLKEEWQERNELLRSEYALEEKHRKVLEQNRLYDLLQAVTQKQLDKIALLMKEYQEEEKNPDIARAVLAKIAVLCSYIKRRKHLELIADRDYNVSREELKMAFSESLHTLGLLNVESSLFVNIRKQLQGTDAAMLYDFFEDVLEADMDGLRSLDTRVVERTEGLRIALTLECNKDISFLKKIYPDALFDNYEGEQTCLLTLRRGGDGK